MKQPEVKLAHHDWLTVHRQQLNRKHSATPHYEKESLTPRYFQLLNLIHHMPYRLEAHQCMYQEGVR